jgi:3-(methylthio)propionyl---CoA ligase
MQHQPGLMMDPPLLIASILEHAAAQRAEVEIVSRETEGAVSRYTVAESAARVRRLANAVAGLGLSRGDMVGSIAWSNHRHLEAYFAVSGSGMILHTCNPRLHAAQLVYIINHADDRVMLFDVTFAALIESIAPQCPRVTAWVCMTDAQRMPALASLRNIFCYEHLLAAQPERFAWPQFDERLAAALCYTSGTTGNPKGVLYSHRSMVLNAMMICTPGVIGLSARETVLPIVPMFHVNGWCIPYAALISGAKMVLPGPRLDGASIYELMQNERVTVSAGVPTVWLQLLQHLEQHDLRFSSLQRIVAGGAAMPTALTAKLAENYGVEVRQGWGMTETVAVATISVLDAEQMSWPAAQRHALISKQGKSVFGIEIKVVDEHGAMLPRDGASQGELLVRGQWIATGYYKSEHSPLIDGWFPTGDIATIDPQGVMQIRDRAKDLIKTGGEWISSLDLENAAAAHPEVAAAAVIGVRHPKWQERPLLFVVRKPNCNISRDAMLEFLAQRLARWWVPDDVIFLDGLPVGGTGKVQKAALREKYGNVFDQPLSSRPAR